MPVHPSSPTKYDLLTKVLDPRHDVILRDWLEFLDVPPQQLVAYVPADRGDIHARLDALTAEFGIPWHAVSQQSGEDLKNEETAILRRMVAQCAGDYLLFINLDTLPFRNPSTEPKWLEEVFGRLEQETDLHFFSGCGLHFRGDVLEAGGRYRRTQRFSNNFGLLRRTFWLTAMDRFAVDDLDDETRRFHSEWALEEMFRQDNLWGLRRVDTLDWRVFHVQQWDDRLLQTRALFKQGRGVHRYLDREHESTVHRWDYHYNSTPPPLVSRARVWLGRHRRRLWGWIKTRRPGADRSAGV